MPDLARLRVHLADLAQSLTECGEWSMASAAEAAATGSDSVLTAFLVSNELWGGAGSIADQAGCSSDRTDDRRRIEADLIMLGRLQINAGLVNVRTASWVAAFEDWSGRGI